MRKIIMMLLLISSSVVQANQLKVFWQHDFKATDGSAVTITAFKAYWGVGTNPRTNAIQWGPPSLIPFKVVSGSYYFAKTMDNVAWTPGTQVCMDMTALADKLESAHSNFICKTVPSNPTEPVIIDLTTP